MTNDPDAQRTGRFGVFDAICKKTELDPTMLRILPAERALELIRAEGFPVPADAPVADWLKEYADHLAPRC